MPLQIDGSAVWNAFQQEDWYKTETQPFQREILKPLVESAPCVLREILEEPLSLTSIVRARILFLSYCLENDLVGKLLQGIFQQRGILVMNGESIRQEFNNCIQKWEIILADPVQYLSKAGINEIDFIFDPDQVGLAVNNLETYLTGKLTVGNVLLSQPGVIVKC